MLLTLFCINPVTLYVLVLPFGVPSVPSVPPVRLYESICPFGTLKFSVHVVSVIDVTLVIVGIDGLVHKFKFLELDGFPDKPITLSVNG